MGCVDENFIWVTDKCSALFKRDEFSSALPWAASTRTSSGSPTSAARSSSGTSSPRRYHGLRRRELHLGHRQVQRALQAGRVLLGVTMGCVDENFIWVTDKCSALFKR